MRYQVFQDGKPADIDNFPDVKSMIYYKSIFSTFEEAVEYAHLWSFPYQMPKCMQRKMQLNVPVDLGHNEIEVMMEIREVL